MVRVDAGKEGDGQAREEEKEERKEGGVDTGTLVIRLITAVEWWE